MVLAGLMREDVAAALVFDMHNEYAFDDSDSDRGTTVRGLKTLFGQKVQVAALGKGATIGSRTPDFTLEIGYNDFEIADIEMLSGELKLTDTAASTLNALYRSFKQHWFARFMKLEPAAKMTDEEGRKYYPPGSIGEWADGSNVHVSAAETLHNRLSRITSKEYVVETPAVDAVGAIVDKLVNGRHVILGFGKFEHDLDYLLVSNILTRKIRQEWVKMTEKFKSADGPRPRPLLIAIEEAHKLLNSHLASQTTFGIIARELRKYYVTLLVVDQRPSGIDDEIMSQLGTRITGWLGDEDDIRAVLTGLAGREQLRGMLARLQEKEEVLLLGWGVKMPIPVKSRRYDEQFYQDMKKQKRSKKGGATSPSGNYSFDDANDELFG